MKNYLFVFLLFIAILVIIFSSVVVSYNIGNIEKPSTVETKSDIKSTINLEESKTIITGISNAFDCYKINVDGQQYLVVSRASGSIAIIKHETKEKGD